MTESFASPAAQRKAEHEIAAFRDYQQLSRNFVDVNEKICRVRPVEDTHAGGKKTAEAIQQEVSQEVTRMLGVVFGSWRKTGRVDLEAVEMLVRGSMHQAGAASLGHLLSMPVARTPQSPAPAAKRRVTTTAGPNSV